jgi:hypothetical protein
MQSGVISASQLSANQRWDAGFLLLQARHKPIVDELVEKYTPEELIGLAQALPFHSDAAKTIWPHTTYGGGTNISEAQFRSRYWTTFPPLTLATYCAAVIASLPALQAKEAAIRREEHRRRRERRQLKAAALKQLAARGCTLAAIAAVAR